MGLCDPIQLMGSSRCGTIPLCMERVCFVAACCVVGSLASGIDDVMQLSTLHICLLQSRGFAQDWTWESRLTNRTYNTIFSTTTT